MFLCLKFKVATSQKAISSRPTPHNEMRFIGVVKIFGDYTSAAADSMDDLDGITRLKAML